MNYRGFPSHPSLDVLPGIAAHFIGRISGIEVGVEREEAISRLAPYQREILRSQGLGDYPLVTAEQVHGKKIALVGTSNFELQASKADGLITSTRGITLGISVADCAPVWIVARDGSAGALLHSGKKGTELGIITEGIRALSTHFSLAPSQLLLVIGPCIRPPCYDIDFAATIRNQAKESGIEEIHDDLICTACHPELYYSYRSEKGLTGRMLATLTLLP